MIPLTLAEAHEFLCETHAEQDKMTTLWCAYIDLLNKHPLYLDFVPGRLGPINFSLVVKTFDTWIYK